MGKLGDDFSLWGGRYGKCIGSIDKGPLMKKWDQVMQDPHAGLHNVSCSTRYTNSLWLSLQYANKIVRYSPQRVSWSQSGSLDAPCLEFDATIECPNVVKDFGVVGGPHCVREDQGVLWVALKGLTACNPNSAELEKDGTVLPRPCCSQQIGE